MTDQPRKRPPGRPVETPGLQQKTIWLTRRRGALSTRHAASPDKKRGLRTGREPEAASG